MFKVIIKLPDGPEFTISCDSARWTNTKLTNEQLTQLNESNYSIFNKIILPHPNGQICPADAIVIENAKPELYFIKHIQNLEELILLTPYNAI